MLQPHETIFGCTFSLVLTVPLSGRLLNFFVNVQTVSSSSLFTSIDVMFRRPSGEGVLLECGRTRDEVPAESVPWS